MMPAAAALAVTLLALALLIPLSPRLGLVDRPAGRKDHAAPVPVAGGIGVYLGLAVALGLLLPTTPATLALLAAGAMLIAMGVADDLRDVHWLPRICSQAGAALILVLGGVALTHLGHGSPPLTLALGLMSVPVTVFAVVGIINALNMIDGVDGLSGSVALVSFVLLGACAALDGQPALTAVLGVCAACTAGFLAFNLRIPGRVRALTFLGNSGSALIGLMLAYATIELTHAEGSTITPALGPWMVALPILDCLTLIVRRLLDGRSPFAADRGHLHHLLLDRGWTATGVVMAAATLQALLAAAGWGLHRLGMPDLGLILSFILLIGAHYWLTAQLGKRTGLWAMQVSEEQR